jgi:hypothetical protein
MAAEMKAQFLIGLAAMLIAGADGRARAADGAADPKPLVKDGDRAAARRDWDAAASDYGEAAKIAPDDARLRDKLRRALDRRARACEARAAKPPPAPQPIPPMFEQPHDSSLEVMWLEERRWHTQLAREALEARADAEAARPKLDAAKIARLRAGAADKRKEEDSLSAQIAEKRAKTAAANAKNEKEMEKAFEGVGGLGVGGGGGAKPMKGASP